MIGFERSDDYQPLFWVSGRPVHVATLLVAIHIFSLVAYCLLRGLNLGDPVAWLDYSSVQVLHHAQVWRVVTYAFVHVPTLWFILDMAMLFLFGREVERFFGRKVFATLYAGLVLTAPVLLMLIGLLRGGSEMELMSVDGLAGAVDGGWLVDFGVFIAFVTIYPSVQIFFGIPSLWIAMAMLAINTLLFFANHAFTALTVLWAETGVAFLGTRYASMGSDAFAFFDTLRDRFPRKTVPRGVKPRLKPRRALDPAGPGERLAGGADGGGGGDYRPGGDVHESIDPLLDKISKHGLASLTHSERATLERARVSLLRKERGG